MSFNEPHLTLTRWQVEHKRIFVCADLNSPLNNPVNTTTHALPLKLERLLPTLAYLKIRNARITLATHIGRPTNQDSVHDKAYSTTPYAELLIQQGFSCTFSRVEDLPRALAGNHDIIMLENMRYYPEEYTLSHDFAHTIAQECSFFIQDAFGSLMRTQTSITTVTTLFDLSHRSIGFLVQGELNHLSQLKNNPKKPFMIIIGGGKGIEKIEILYRLLDIATHIALAPGVTELPAVADIIKKAREKSVTVLIPEDYLIINGTKVSIGPRTMLVWTPVIMSMHTIVYNGFMGFIDQNETTVITYELYKLILSTQAKIVFAGGDTTQALVRWQLALSEHVYLSTGGGATLAYIGGIHLPGLDGL